MTKPRSAAQCIRDVHVALLELERQGFSMHGDPTLEARIALLESQVAELTAPRPRQRLRAIVGGRVDG